MIITKGSIIKFECKTHRYMIYFDSQVKAVEYLYSKEIAEDLKYGSNIEDIMLTYTQRMNMRLNRKKGYMAHTEEHGTDNRLFRLFYKPDDIEFNTVVETIRFYGVYETREYYRKLDELGNPSRLDYNDLQDWDNSYTSPVSYYRKH